MIDFWEIIGHTVIDDAFRKTMYDTFQASNATANPATEPDNPYSCFFDPGDIDKARGLILGKMGPVSVLGISEWLVLAIILQKNRPAHDAVATAVQYLLKGQASNDPNFYRLLGAMIIDSVFRDDFINGNEANYGFKLGPADRSQLATVAADGGFKNAADAFHSDVWVDSCFSMAKQSAAEPAPQPLEFPFE